MVDQEELAICRRRGHDVIASEEGWMQCGACGMWVLEKRTLEEREAEPPEEELDPGLRTDRRLEALRARLEEQIRTRGLS